MLASACGLRPHSVTMHVSARSRGTNWFSLLRGLSCATVLSFACAGTAIDNTGQGGSGNINVGGTAGSTTTVACFSPTQHLELIKPMASGGCPCTPGSASVCIQGTGLICSNNYWIAVWDGPCLPSTGGAGSVGGSGAGGKATGGSSTGGASGAKACGARAGNSCTANEYCAYQPGQYCGQADAEATCQLRPQGCDAVYTPVCGCDGKTYGNSCEAAISGTGVYANGACTS